MMRSRQRLVWLVGACLLWATAAQATVLIAESSFEGANPDADGWLYASGVCSASPCQYLDVSTDVAHAGSKSLKGLYPAGALLNPTGEWNQGLYHRFVGNVSATDVYLRYWYRTTAFSYGPTTGTKHIYWKGTLGYPNFFSINWFGSREKGFAGQNLATGAAKNYYPNIVPHISLADDTWYCIEEHVKLNTPGQPNGVLESWVNGSLTTGFYTETFRPTTSVPGGAQSNMAFTLLEIYKQTGSGSMYYDQFKAATTRAEVACGTAPTGDTTPPVTPIGLRVD